MTKEGKKCKITARVEQLSSLQQQYNEKKRKIKAYNATRHEEKKRKYGNPQGAAKFLAARQKAKDKKKKYIKDVMS